MLQKIWRSSQISRKLKVRLYKSNVLSVLLYGSEYPTTNYMRQQRLYQCQQRLKEGDLDGWGTSCAWTKEEYRKWHSGGPRKEEGIEADQKQHGEEV